MTKALHVCLTGAKSQAHLIYVASYLRDVLTREPDTTIKVSLVEARAFLSAPAVTAEVARRLLPQDERLCVEDGMPGWRFDEGSRGEYVSVGAPGIKPWLKLRRANPTKRFRVVVTDEGVGTYGGVAQRASAMMRQGAKAPLAWGKAAAIVGAARALTSTRWAAFVHDADGWRVNEAVAAEFRRWVPAATPGADPTAVIVTQPFADMGLISETAQLNYVRALTQAATEAGFAPIVRPHPAEPSGRYAEFTVADGAGTLELDPQIVRSSVVLGGPSTGLITLNAFHGLPVVWVTIPTLASLDSGVSTDQAGLFRTFLGEPVDVHHVDGALAQRLGSHAT